jgi:hypothetical protein
MRTLRTLSGGSGADEKAQRKPAAGVVPGCPLSGISKADLYDRYAAQSSRSSRITSVMEGGTIPSQFIGWRRLALTQLSLSGDEQNLRRRTLRCSSALRKPLCTAVSAASRWACDCGDPRELELVLPLAASNMVSRPNAAVIRALLNRHAMHIREVENIGGSARE